MRHLLITLGFPPDIGGMQQFLYARCQSSDAGEVVVLAPDSPGSASFDTEQSFDIYRWNNICGNIPGVKRLFQVLLSAYRSWRIYRSQGFDVIECGQALPCGLVALVFERILGIPYIVWAHGNDIMKPQRWLITRWLLINVLRGAQLIIANSHNTADQVRKFGVKSDNITVIHPPVDHQRFHLDVDANPVLREYGLRGHKVILTVARLFPRKGIDTVIRALPHVKEEILDVVYLVVGEGPDRQRLERLVGTLGLGDHVVFAGSVSDAELPAFYAACDVFVMLSRTIETDGEIEGFGIVYLEAGACGKPVIGGASGGVQEAIEDGVTGLIVDPQNPSATARAIVRLLRDESLARTLGRHGRRRACQPADWTPLKVSALRYDQSESQLCDRELMDGVRARGS